ncbi:MAG: AAA family ATPase [Candidatus Latescibacter sp.]|nr:AAA family ATPase [Candidatus Latescibacter sp.]
MLIEKLKIRSFKSIVDLDISLGNVNVFIGANGSGKSNILEALGVLSAAAYGRVDDESLLRRGVRPGVPRLYKSAFPTIRIPPHIYFAAEAENASYAVSLLNSLDKPRPAWQFKTEELIGDSITLVSRGVRGKTDTARNKEQGLAALKVVELDPKSPAAELMQTLQDYAIYTPNTPTLRGMISDQQSRDPVGLSGGRLAEAVRDLKSWRAAKVDFIDDALDEMTGLIDWMSDFDTSTSAEPLLSSSIARGKLIIRFKDRYMREGRNTLTPYDASEGVLYILFSAVLAIYPFAPQCLAIDNLDQSLNPRLSQKLVKALCKWVIDNPYPRQFLFTAHNPALLDGLPLNDDRIRLFAVDRNDAGHTEVRRIEITDELKKLNEKWPLSRLWVMGHLGGVPNV